MPVPQEPGETVVVDATVIIHLAKAEHLALLGCVKGWAFVVPDQVVAEVTYADQAAALARALAAGHLLKESSTDPREIAIYAELRQRMGRGEAACLAMASCRGWMVASDDQGRAFRRLVREHIGEGRLIDTAAIVQTACEQGELSPDEAQRITAIAEGA